MKLRPNQKSSLTLFWVATHQLRNTAISIWRLSVLTIKQRRWLLEKPLGSTLSEHATSVCVCPLFGVVASGAGGGRVRKEEKKNWATFVFQSPIAHRAFSMLS